MHLSPDELIDLAEGTRLESVTIHLQSCEICRHQLAELRAVIATVADVKVPEPSPLFWGRLSARVHEAVAAEGLPRAPRETWSHAGWWRTAPLAAGVIAATAAVALAVYLTMLPRATPPSAPALGVLTVPGAVDGSSLEPFGAADDLSLALVADLTSQMDPELATETGVTNHIGSVDEAVSNLTAGERLELQRLLKEALAKPGA